MRPGTAAHFEMLAALASTFQADAGAPLIAPDGRPVVRARADWRTGAVLLERYGDRKPADTETA